MARIFLIAQSGVVFAMTKMLDRTIIILFVLTVIAVAIPQVGLMAAFTGFGLFITVGMWLAPALLLILTLFLIVNGLLPSRLPTRPLIALAVVLSLLAIPPVVLNQKIDAEALAKTANDHNDLVLPIKQRVIAVRQNWYWRGSDTIECDAFCLHALLTGTADKVLLAHTDDTSAKPNQQQQAIGFRFEQRATCPAVKFPNSDLSLDLPQADGSKGRVRATDLVNLRLSRRDCLIRYQTSLAEADLVISWGDKQNTSRPINDGFLLDVDTISTTSMVVHARDTVSADFQEVYRKTGVSYRPFGYLMVPTLLLGSMTEAKLGWWRLPKSINISAGSDNPQRDWAVFLTETMQFDLALDDMSANNQIGSSIEAAMSAGRAPTGAEWLAYSSYTDNAIVMDKPSKPVFDLQMKVLADPNFPPPPRLYATVTHAAKQQQALLPGLADLLVKRALAGQTWPHHIGVSEDQSLATLDPGIWALPNDALQPYLAEMIELSKKDAARTSMMNGLSKLHVYGDAAVPAMLDLMMSGVNGGENFFRVGHFQRPYLAGLQGLCLAGDRAPSALPSLQDWLAQKRLPLHAGYGDLLIATMVRLGAQPDEIWQNHFMGKSTRNRAQFDRVVKRSQSQSFTCLY
jgi:hypothetical protein